MNLLLMANSGPLGFPTRPDALWVPGLDTQGRNIARNPITSLGKTYMTLSSNSFYETTDNDIHIINITGEIGVNPVGLMHCFTPVGRKRFWCSVGNPAATTSWVICDTSTIAIVASGAGVINPVFLNNGDGTFTLSMSSLNSGGNGYTYFGTGLDTMSSMSERTFTGDITKGVSLSAWQVNFNSLYPYSAPSGLPQSLADRSGKGNSAQNGSASAWDTNDGAFSGTGWVAGTDDFLKIAKGGKFDDLAVFTVMTAFKAPTASGTYSPRIIDKTKKIISLTQTTNKLRSVVSRETSVHECTSGNAMTAGTNYVAGVIMPTVGNIPSMFINSNQETVTEVSAGSGAWASDASYDLYSCNDSTAAVSLASSMYAQAIWFRTLSVSQYIQNLNAMKRLCLKLGVTI